MTVLQKSQKAKWTKSYRRKRQIIIYNSSRSNRLPPSMIKTSDKDSVTCPSLSGIKRPSSKNTGSVVYNFLSDDVVESALETSRYQWTPQDDGATPRSVSGKGRRSSRVKVRQPKKREVKQPHAESSNDNRGELVFVTSMNTVNQQPVGCELVFQTLVRTVPEEDIEKEAYAVSRQCMDDGRCTVQREKGKRSGRRSMVWSKPHLLTEAMPHPLIMVWRVHPILFADL